MSVYVIDAPRFDKRCPNNVRLERLVVFGMVGEGGGASVSAVHGRDGSPLDLGSWFPSERIALHEEMRKADRQWRALTQTLGREDEAPGRVA